MPTNRPFPVGIIGLGCFALQIVHSEATGAEYVAQEMRRPIGAALHTAQSISEDGRVGGYLQYPDTGGLSHPVVWDAFGEPALLNFPQVGTVLGFRSDGTPLGVVSDANGQVSAAVWDQSGFRTLPDLGLGSGAYGGDQNFIVGQVTESPSPARGRAAIWDASGLRLVQGLGDLRFQRVYSINSSGTYVGVAQGTNFAGGFIGSGDTATLLNYPGFAGTRSFDINDDGWISGIWSNNGLRRGFVARGDEIKDLGLFGNNIETWTGEINNSGTVVGAAANGSSFTRALVWDHFSQSPKDLNLLTSNLPPGEVLTYAYEINNAGQILVLGNNGFYVLTPIPEPAALFVLAAGFVVLRSRRACFSTRERT